MKDKIYRFMYGRNGADHYSRFLTYLSIVPIIVSMVIGGTAGSFLWYLAIAIIIYAYFRIFSKNLDRRRAENAAYLRAKGKFTGGFKNRRERLGQRREYKFFKCPSCKAMLRVPRGKGKVRVTCRKCGNAFERKT